MFPIEERLFLKSEPFILVAISESQHGLTLKLFLKWYSVLNYFYSFLLICLFCKIEFLSVALVVLVLAL